MVPSLSLLPCAARRAQMWARLMRFIGTGLINVAPWIVFEREDEAK